MTEGYAIEIGEGFVGHGGELAHVNTVLGLRDGPVGTAWATALATPRAGHLPFVAVVQPGLAVTPPTLFVNKAPLAGERHERLTWGAAQAGVAEGVASALHAGIISPVRADELALIVAVWVAPEAFDPELVYTNNRRATVDALRAGHERRPRVDEVVAARDEAWNPYFRAR